MSFITDFSWILGVDKLLLLAFLVFLEIALSIDNFAGMREALDGLPETRKRAIRSAASLSGLVLRVALICLFIEMTLLLNPFVQSNLGPLGMVSGKALFLTLGGTFLILKAVANLRGHLSAEQKPVRKLAQTNGFSIWIQLAYIDLILSLDSVIAALSMVNSVKLIIVAMIIAHLTLHLNWEKIDSFFARRSSMMTLTLAFILLLGIVSLFRGLGAVLAEETLLAALMFGLLLEGLNGKDKHGKVEEGLGRKIRRKQARSSRERRPVTTRDGDSNQGGYATITDAQQRQSLTEYLEEFKLELAAERATELPALDLFQETNCSSCNTQTQGIFPFCLACGQSRSEEDDLACPATA